MQSHDAHPFQPPVWNQEQLEAERAAAVARFIEERGRGGTQAYRDGFAQVEPIVRRLFAASNDLLAVSGELLRREPDFVAAARFLAAPPISVDDLTTFAGGPVEPHISEETANAVAELLAAVWDPIRLPWIGEAREPTNHERETAILWTAGIWAVERLRTLRRTVSSRQQEEAVVSVLKAAKFEQRRRVRRMNTLDVIPRGAFMREVILAGAKCDIPVRLRDGRLMALECKVSNSALNSVKRLLRETGGKARRWRDAFGEQVITGAVLAGVYKLGNLVEAQETYEITIFWQHGLRPLHEFLDNAR